jgi:heme A synthase
MDSMSRLARFAWSVVAYNIGVILWGAYVRASGSGAGCGSHWPLCNGAILPRSPTAATLIEFSHRVTSGLALVAVIVLLVWTWRNTRPGDPARTGAVWTVVFMVTEALVGAGLVLFRLVADNATMARAMFMAVHLVNTFLLIAALTLTAYWLSGGPAPALTRRLRAGLLALAAIGMLLIGTSGAVAALGDTLFPSTSIGAGLSADFSATSHLLIRLRVLHPALAIGIGLAVLGGALRLGGLDPMLTSRARLVAGLIVVQLAAGLLNVILLAPVWLQMVHLLLADAVWIAFVLLAAGALRRETVPVRDGGFRVPSERTLTSSS